MLHSSLLIELFLSRRQEPKKIAISSNNTILRLLSSNVKSVSWQLSFSATIDFTQNYFICKDIFILSLDAKILVTKIPRISMLHEVGTLVMSRCQFQIYLLVPQFILSFAHLHTKVYLLIKWLITTYNLSLCFGLFRQNLKPLTPFLTDKSIMQFTCGSFIEN